MSDSILQVNLIKNKGGTATGITVDNSNANISIGTNLAVNTINEVTSANGVSIDGLKVKDNCLVTNTNKYDFLTGSFTGASGTEYELNSRGILNHNFFGAVYNLSADHAVAQATDTEIDATWTKFSSTGTSGSTDSDPFGKFNSGRWTPTVSGFYLCIYSVRVNGLTAGDNLITKILRNSTDAANLVAGQSKIQAGAGTANSISVVANGCGILAMDTNDYASLFVYHDNATGTKNVKGTSNTNIGFYFLGTNL